MKQKDIAIIAVAVIISGTLSYIISSKLFAIPQNQEAEVEVVEPITADFTQPDSRYFNKDSIDPTQPIKIGDSQNNQPFNDSGN